MYESLSSHKIFGQTLCWVKGGELLNSKAYRWQRKGSYISSYLGNIFYVDIMINTKYHFERL